MATPGWLEHNRNLSFQQFRPSEVGPAEARRMTDTAQGIGEEYRYKTPREQAQERTMGKQQRLFPLSDVALPKPHTQTRAQFAADPRTWWHGRYSEALPRTGGARNAGVHVGSLEAAQSRQDALGASHRRISGSEAMQPYRFFPVRLQGDIHSAPGEFVGHDEGATWRGKPGLHYYRNQVEAKGSISALAPNRSFLQTHGEAVKAAVKSGVPVHPNILWEQKQLGRREYDIGKQDLKNRPFNLNPNVQGRMFGANEMGDLDAKQHRRNLAYAAGIKSDHPNYASYVIQGLH